MVTVEQPPEHTPTKRPVAIGLLTVFVAIALAVALFVQLSGYGLLTTESRDRTYSTVLRRTVSYDTPAPPFIMTYPVTGNHRADSLIREYATKIADSYLRNRTPDTPKDQQLSITYEIVFYDQKTISVLFTEQIKQGSRQIKSQNNAAVFDLTQRKHVSPRDILADVSALNNILYDYLRVNNSTPSYSSKELVHILDLQPSDFTSIVPYGDKIAFSFNIPVSAKQETIAIHKSLLSGIVQPAYQTTSTDHAHNERSFAKTISVLPSRDQPVGPNDKKLALTFDDGPDGDTPRLLDALRKYRAHATFFVIGNKATSTVSTLQRTVNEGHEIGNHTWSHPNLTQLSPDQVGSQILDTQNAIKQATGGYTPRLVRPPYGAINDAVSRHLQGLHPTLWTVDTRDWQDKNADVIYSRIMAEAKQGSIILLHDVHSSSVDAAIRAIRDLRADGWQLVTVSQL